MGQANSNSWVRTSTKDDGTKFQTAYRTNTIWNDDPNGIPSVGSFITNLQVDSVAIDAGITGGGTNATWSTGATRGVGAGGIWSRTFKDDDATDKGFVLPDAGWDDLMDRSSNFQSQVNNNTASSIAKAFSTKGFGLGRGLDSIEGATREILRSQGTGNMGSEETDGDAGIRTQPQIGGTKDDDGTRKRPYNSNIPLYYPIALRNNRSQDKLKISVLKYAPREKGDSAFKLGDRPSRRLVEGSVFLPVPGGVGDQNTVSWGPDSMNPMDLALANTAFDLIKDGDFKTAGADAKKTIDAAVKDPDTKSALAGLFTKAAGINGNILTRKTGAVVNPNMELLFNAPSLRPFAFTYRMSPRDRGESVMVRKIIRMFKQSMAVKRTKSTLFLKSPSTYQLEWRNGQSRSKNHEYLPMIKECALTAFNVNYTPDGNYATYDDSSMVSYEIQFSFQELEPIYNDDYTKIDGNSDTHIGY
jgi:hypothetical protein